jgi:exodeoxyribonuclease V alpha subunit
VTDVPPAMVDPFSARRAQVAGDLLRAFNDAGVLTAGDVQIATRLAAIAGDDDPEVVLATAFAVRAPRLSHVLVDLPSLRETVAVDADEPVDAAALPWPDPTAWLQRLADSPLVAGDDEVDGPPRPLRLVGNALYLDRYWREERQVAADLLALRDAPAADLADGDVDERVHRLLGDAAAGSQGLAARAATGHALTVIAGGPGTGKTTTVAAIAALLAEQTGPRRPLLALVAPTGKAAARLQESVRASAHALDVDAPIADWMADLEASTLHRLLGRRPGSHSRFLHHRGRRLPHDVVIVDEASMVSLSLMARLVEALPPHARLVLVGDPDQLTSIEAGAVLGDIVAAGPAAGIATFVLEHGHRFGPGIDRVATAVRRGDPDATIEALERGDDGVTWIPADPADPGAAASMAPVRERATAGGRAVLDAARAGQGAEALAALGCFRLLCAHRRGSHGVSRWLSQVETWLAADIDSGGTRFYVGRPLMITANDYDLRLFNGDTGVVIAAPNRRPVAAFDRGAGDIITVSPARLGPVDSVYATTIHKSQGSQFDTAAVLLPPPESRILTRELLYTGITRARSELLLVGTEASIRAAIARPATRASGLRRRLLDERSES